MAVEHEVIRDELRAALAQIGGISKPSRSSGAPVAEPAAITDAQAVVLQQLVRDLNARHHAPFQTIWTLVNQHNKVSSYRHTPASKFNETAFYLQHWIDSGLPPA